MEDKTHSAKNPANSPGSQEHSDTFDVDPEYFADVHQTPAGALLFQDERDSDAWISSDVAQEVRR